MCIHPIERFHLTSRARHVDVRGQKNLKSILLKGTPTWLPASLFVLIPREEVKTLYKQHGLKCNLAEFGIWNARFLHTVKYIH